MSVSAGRTATSSLFFETSIPINTFFTSSIIESPAPFLANDTGSLAVPGNCPGYSGENRGDPRFQAGYLSQGGFDLPRPIQHLWEINKPPKNNEPTASIQGGLLKKKYAGLT